MGDEARDDDTTSPPPSTMSSTEVDGHPRRASPAAASAAAAAAAAAGADTDASGGADVQDNVQRVRKSSLADAEMTDASLDAPSTAHSGANGELSAAPMTRSTSASSIPDSSKDAAAAAAAATSAAAPYGTRSRNRPRGERVNYAEDSADVEFEVQQGAADKNAAAAAVVAAAAAANSRAEDRDSTPSPDTSARQSPGPTSRRGGAASNAASAAAAAQPKDPSIPGTSTFSTGVNGGATATASKKRKAGAASTAAAVTNGHAAPNAAGAAAARRAANAAHSHPARESRVYTYDRTGQRLRKGKLEADDGTSFAVDEFVYLVCEPPGEPYYLGRIMEFRHKDLSDPTSPVDSLRVNWFYRPRDVMRSSQDTRLLYATMHSDMCPVTSLRGKVQIRHRDDIDDLDEYRKNKDSFWFDEVFDRFIHRYYKAVPVRRVVNVPDKVKQALNERWKYIVVEQNKVKEMIQEGKNCKRCQTFASPDDSVECAVCKNMYHMQCVRPPLLKKPSRGFGWSCAPCSRAHERNLEARHTPLVGDMTEPEDEEMQEEEEVDTGTTANTTAPSPAPNEEDLHPGTQAEIRLAKMWPMRYLGIHCRPEDALLYDDRAIYPRASSRLGPRHQANVNIWHGRPVELVKPAESRKRFAKASKGAKDAAAAVEADKEARAKRPKWVQDEPPGYVARGEDHPNSSKQNTAKLRFKMPTFGEHSSRGEDDAPASLPDENLVDDYMRRAKAVAKTRDIQETSVDFLDAAVRLFQDNNYDPDAALRGVRNLDPKKDLQDPQRTLSAEEKKRFDEGAAKYGSELRNIRLHVKSVAHRDIVRYWYIWKKTDRGREIWGNFGGRRGAVRKAEMDSHGKLLDDVADDLDDSAFDADKAAVHKRGFCCKFCNAKKARQWRRAPGVAPGSTVSADGKPATKDKTNALFVALCDRCASFWRRYAIKWEEYEEIAKKIAQGGTKQMRRRIDEEVLQEFRHAAEASAGANDMSDAAPNSGAEPAKKKQKFADKEGPGSAKQKAPPKQPTPPPPPIVPTPARFRDLPCAVCDVQTEPADSTAVVCSSCRLTVHRNCYGIQNARAGKWTCDTCTNDRKETVSYDYKCVLCPVEHRTCQLVETPRPNNKKKGDREKEKEKLEKDLADALEREYKQEQKAKNRPLEPREALKRTAANNWVHLTCAVWSPETKFGDAVRLDLVEGIPQIPKVRYEQVCKLCKSTDGACVQCHHCHATFHVGCAQLHGYVLGFDVTPVKGSRRESTNIVSFGAETGMAVAAVWCKDHPPKTIVHHANELVDEQEGTYALQRFVLNTKQADLTLTGTTRKANLLDESAKNVSVNGIPLSANRKASVAGGLPPTPRGGRPSTAGFPGANESREVEQVAGAVGWSDRKCERCGIDTSPRWFPAKATDQLAAANQAGQKPVANGIKHEPASVDTPMTNGLAERAPVLPVEKYYCQKCHWKKINGVEDPEPERKDAERTSTRSPTARHTAIPQTPWTIADPGRPRPIQTLWPSILNSAVPPPQQPAAHISPPRGAFQHNPTGPPPPPPPSAPHQPAPSPRLINLPGAISANAIPPAAYRTPNPASANVPPPLHLAQQQQQQQQPPHAALPNGLTSPSSSHHHHHHHHHHHSLAQQQQHSPTRPPHVPAAQRQPASPYTTTNNNAAHARPTFPAPPHHHPAAAAPPSSVHGSSSQPQPPLPPSSATSVAYGRPTTPRDAMSVAAAQQQQQQPGGGGGPPREQSAPPGGGGASASPSLRNLLH